MGSMVLSWALNVSLGRVVTVGIRQGLRSGGARGGERCGDSKNRVGSAHLATGAGS